MEHRAALSPCAAGQGWVTGGDGQFTVMARHTSELTGRGFALSLFSNGKGMVLIPESPELYSGGRREGACLQSPTSTPLRSG